MKGATEELFVKVTYYKKREGLGSPFKVNLLKGRGIERKGGMSTGLLVGKSRSFFYFKLESFLKTGGPSGGPRTVPYLDSKMP